MQRNLRRFLTIATVLALSLLVFSARADGTRRRAVAPPDTPGAPVFQPNQIEAYLGDDGLAYIRPGVKLIILSVTNVEPGKKPEVEIRLTDQFDQPLDRLGKVTPGPIAPAFVLGQWNADSRYYHSLTTRTRNGVTTPWVDTGGSWTDFELGHSKYTFATIMPANLDATATLTLGGYAKRTLLDILGKDYFADNVFKDFRPDSGEAAPVWNVTTVAAACNRCHDPLAQHGGNRREVKLCMMCHTVENTVDPASGNTYNGKVFFHKIHMGSSLPSVKAGTPYIAGGDFSTVVFPQDIRNCTTCHDPNAREADIWYTRPSRDVCGSCHDDVNFATGENHPGGIQTSDSGCKACHQSSGGEFDGSIQGAHTIPAKSKQLKGLTATIAGIDNVGPGKKPTVTFAIKNDDGTPVDGTKVRTFSPILAGPTSNYSTFWRENGLASGSTPGTFDAAAGTTSYSFTHALPEDATGTWTMAADISRNAGLKRGDGNPDITVREVAFNPVKSFVVTGPLTMRRTAVAVANCNVCHDTLALHGGNRRNPEECVICHNPTNSDVAGRPASAGAPESISFQRHIHRIHTGENLTQEWSIYGGSGTATNFNEVRFPGDRRNCRKCHLAGAYTLPLQTGIASVDTPRDYFSPQGPATAACLGCHDNRDAAAHAWLNTTTFGGTTTSEACATCHGRGKDWDVEKKHAR